MRGRNSEPKQRLRVICGGEDRELRPGECATVATDATYRDAPTADLLSLIAEIDAGMPWRQAVAARYAQSNPWLARIVTDPCRDLFFRLHPPHAKRILDVGAGWGQIALPLARRACVCALEPTPERMQFIRTAARQDGLLGSMWFVQADLFDVTFPDAFDFVTCVGVLEWVPKFRPDNDPVEAQRAFLARVRRALAPGGTLVIGIENRLGLKYVLGAPDDHLGEPNIAVFDHTLAGEKWRERTDQPLPCVTHTRAELNELLSLAGFRDPRYFCAFPDYKLPQEIVTAGKPTDEFLARHFVPEHEGFTGTQLHFQAELKSHYQTLARLGIASEFAPSYFVVATAAGDETMTSRQPDHDAAEATPPSS